MEFATRYKRPQNPWEKGGGPRITESAGYVPAEKQIRDFMLAGQRLAVSRQEAYDFPDGIEDENFDDPTRHPNFDMSDAAVLARAAVDELNCQEEEYKKAQKLQKEKNDAEYAEYKKNKETEKKE